MADTKKIKLDDLPARAKVLDEKEAGEVYGGAGPKRGKRKPPARGKGKGKGKGKGPRRGKGKGKAKGKRKLPLGGKRRL